MTEIARIKPATDPEHVAEHWRSVALENSRDLMVAREALSIVQSVLRLTVDGRLSPATALETTERIVSEVMP